MCPSCGMSWKTALILVFLGYSIGMLVELAITKLGN